jgi:hypothetical protein
VTTKSQHPAAAQDTAPPMGKMGQTIHNYGDERGTDYVAPGREGAYAVECLQAQGAISESETNPDGPTGD